MTDSMDALYRDWRRWRDKLEPLAESIAEEIRDFNIQHLGELGHRGKRWATY
jgi:hypothetical protein